jgi:hypothetical protein
VKALRFLVRSTQENKYALISKASAETGLPESRIDDF